MSDTPETDALERRFGNKMPEKMRNLERQRDEARRELVRIDAAYGKKVVLAASLLRERDAATDLARELRDKLRLITYHGHADHCLFLCRANAPCDCGVDGAETLIAKANQLLCN